MSKDKKKKKDKKGSKGDASLVGVGHGLKSMAENPMVQHVVAAALVATAAALKDSDKARKLASDAGDQLTDLSKANADRGNAMWALALDIGRRTLETIAGEDKPPKAGK